MSGHQHHDHAPADYSRAFAIGIALNTVYVVVEALYGLSADSLALLADAGHNLSDVAGLLLAWGAFYLANRVPTARRTYGFRRLTILASVISALILLVAIGAVAWEAIGRFAQPQPVDGMTVLVVAAIGTAINAVTAWLFLRGRHDDLNIRGAFLHMAADAAVSLGVVISGVVILTTGWLLIDPILSLVIVAVVLYSTWGLLKESLSLIIDTVPRHIDPAEVERYLRDLPGVDDVHDLHIWAVSTTDTVLTAHLQVRDGGPGVNFLNDVSEELHHRFDIGHTTIQLEYGDSAEECRQAHAGF